MAENKEPRTMNQITGWGGYRPNSGRKKGSVNKYSKKLLLKSFEGGEHPMEYFLRIMRDDEQPEKMRMYAAGQALPYCAPKLSQTTIQVESDLDNMSLEQKILMAQGLRDRILELKPKAKLPKLPPLNGESKRVG